MGHTVKAVPINTKYAPDEALFFMPSLEELEALDGIILSGLEHIWPYLSAAYSMDEWRAIKTPKAAWMHETFDRPDVRPFAPLRPWADTHFFPSTDDARNIGGIFLPFAADTDVFKPEEAPPREIPVGFVGVLYPKRAEYLNRLYPFLQSKGITLDVRSVVVRRGGEINHEETVKRYVHRLNRTTIFLNLPAMSSLYVTKVFEAMACGTFVMTPHIPNHRGLIRSSAFREYLPEQFEDIAYALKETLDCLEYRDMVGMRAVEEIKRNHRLDQRCEEILKCL
jgi:glycosyltransferase involved in cell wall biosynthesis